MRFNIYIAAMDVDGCPYMNDLFQTDSIVMAADWFVMGFPFFDNEAEKWFMPQRALQ